ANALLRLGRCLSNGCYEGDFLTAGEWGNTGLDESWEEVLGRWLARPYGAAVCRESGPCIVRTRPTRRTVSARSRGVALGSPSTTRGGSAGNTSRGGSSGGRLRRASDERRAAPQ